jgi:hypothetical protein
MNRITKLTIAASAIWPLATTLVLLWQHSSESGNPAILGRWTYSYFVVALSPTMVTIPVLTLLWLRRSSNTINFAVAVFSVFVILVPLEAVTHTRAATVFSPQFITFIPDSCVRDNIANKRGFLRQASMISFDGVPGQQIEPNAALTVWVPAEVGHTRTYDIRVDRNGMNNDPSVAGREQIDLIIVGDSFTFGSVPRENNYVSVASRLLNQPILNLGRGGTGPHEQRWAVEKIGLGYQPETVVWQFFENDPYESVAMEEWLSDYPELLFADFLKKIQLGENAHAFRQEKCRRIALNSPFLFLGMVQQARTRMNEAPLTDRMEMIPIAGSGGEAEPGHFVFSKTDFSQAELCTYPLSNSEWQGITRVATGSTVIQFDVAMAKALRIVEDEIMHLALLSRSRGFDLVLMPVPSKALVYEDQILNHLRSMGRDLTCPDGRPPRLNRSEYYWNEWLRTTAATFDLEFLDLLTYLHREAGNGQNDLFYYSLDDHLNDAGNAATGRFLYDQLVAASGNEG